MDYDSLRSERDDVVRDGAGPEAYRQPGALIDSDHPEIVAWARTEQWADVDRGEVWPTLEAFTREPWRRRGLCRYAVAGLAATNVFTSRLAQMTGAAVLYYATERLPGKQGWRGVLEPAFEDFPSDDAIADTMRYHARIEAQVRRMPEQYWWIHRRFKGLDADYVDPYRDPS